MLRASTRSASCPHITWTCSSAADAVTSTKTISIKRGLMKRALLPILFFLSSPALLATQIGIYQHGTVVRMHMGECLDPRRGFMAALSGTPQLPRSEPCPEYTLVTDKVVYVIVGKFNQLVPLAETI